MVQRRAAATLTALLLSFCCLVVGASSDFTTTSGLTGRGLLQNFDRSDWPYDSCLREPESSPYELIYTGSTSHGIADTVCFVVRVMHNCTGQGLTPDAEAGCKLLSEDLWKVQLEAKNGCKDSIKEVTLDGQPTSYLYVNNKGPTGMMKVTQLRRDASNANGVTMCIRLGGNTLCPTLATLCPGVPPVCKTSFYTNSGKDVTGLPSMICALGDDIVTGRHPHTVWHPHTV
ncbi:hypothetical protein FOA52_009858 [Chlamydomonas sp. UWO 241]|nr:hypothetical protein FOA52_009858 [Chlamydomonas sp. UWO 241]